MKETKRLIDMYLGNVMLNELFKQNFIAVSRARREHGYFVLAKTQGVGGMINFTVSLRVERSTATLFWQSPF